MRRHLEDQAAGRAGVSAAHAPRRRRAARFLSERPRGRRARRLSRRGDRRAGEKQRRWGTSRGDREDHGEDMVWFPSRGWLFLSHSDAGFITSVTVSYWCYIWNVPSRNTPASVICATRAPDRSCVARSLSRLAQSKRSLSHPLVLSPRPPFPCLRQTEGVMIYGCVRDVCWCWLFRPVGGESARSHKRVRGRRSGRSASGCVVRLRAVWGVARLRRPPSAPGEGGGLASAPSRGSTPRDGLPPLGPLWLGSEVTHFLLPITISVTTTVTPAASCG